MHRHTPQRGIDLISGAGALTNELMTTYTAQCHLNIGIAGVHWKGGQEITAFQNTESGGSTK
jgi:hypothetical protein